MTLMLGDCLQKLKELQICSIDAVVTDPPYGLSFMGKKWDYDVPSVEIWREVFRVLKPGGYVLSFGGTRTYHRMVVNIEDAGFEIRDQVQWIYGSGFPKSHNLKDEWQGWGTALKPANEPICLARKPLDKGLTVAENVLKWGTGAINIDEGRIGFANEKDAKEGRSSRPGKTSNANEYALNHGGLEGFDRSNRDHIQGRWPANVLFDEQAAEMLDEQSGPIKTKLPFQKISEHTFGVGDDQIHKGQKFESQKGLGITIPGASRFFYVAKASKRERNAGLEGMPERQASGLPMRSKDGDRGGTGIDETDTDRLTKNQNHHPTVKPIKLMEYLIKLITPPNGNVLDPFMGSGSTGVAAKNLGFNFVGIEMNDEYFEIAKKRIDGC